MNMGQDDPLRVGYVRVIFRACWADKGMLKAQRAAVIQTNVLRELMAASIQEQEPGVRSQESECKNGRLGIESDARPRLANADRTLWYRYGTCARSSWSRFW